MTSFEKNLRNSANWYLYIFIDGAAKLPAAIMNKRSEQIKMLNNMAKLSLTYSFTDCVNIVRQGIFDRYGKTPAEVLQVIFDAATTKVSGIGSPLSESLSDNANLTSKIELDTTDPDTKETTKKNIWTDIASVITWIVELLGKLGLMSNVNVYKNTPQYPDWNGVDSSSGTNLSSLLPILAVGVGGYALFNSAKKGDKKKKSKKE